jgi:glutamate formiminotransferase
VERLVECVPNISEGRDAGIVARIAGSVRGLPTGKGTAPRVWLLDSQTDRDHNRSVLTIAGEPEEVLEAAVRLAGRAAELIDLNRHRGVHPRIGALDVLPFIPLRGLEMSDCAALAERAGAEIWRRYQVPVYLYGEAARRESRRRLAEVRRGQFEGLRLAVRADPGRRPDIGGPALHSTAGAVAAGARKLMIAYNIQLNTSDVELARRVAHRVRESGGGLRHLMAMGVALRSRGIVQVSMNLTDFEVTPLHTVFQLVSREAAAEGAGVLASEIIGLVPQRALDMAAGVDLRWENLTPESILENRLAAVIP